MVPFLPLVLDIDFTVTEPLFVTVAPPRDENPAKNPLVGASSTPFSPISSQLMRVPPPIWKSPSEVHRPEDMPTLALRLEAPLFP